MPERLNFLSIWARSNISSLKSIPESRLSIPSLNRWLELIWFKLKFFLLWEVRSRSIIYSAFLSFKLPDPQQETLGNLGINQTTIACRGFAMQCRVTMQPGGLGQVGDFVEPSGNGIRVDTCLYPGYRPQPFYDPLLLKLIGFPFRSFWSDVPRTFLKVTFIFFILFILFYFFFKH